MYFITALLAILTTATMYSVSSFASDSFESLIHPMDFDMEQIVRCTTNSRGVNYYEEGRDYRHVRNLTYQMCTRNGGNPSDCDNNMRCSTANNPGNPPPPPPPPPYNPPPNDGYYFDWGSGRDGWGYCYEWYRGQVLNGGRPVTNYECERVYPSHYEWGRGQDGYTYCYQFTPYNVCMNQGRPVSNYNCQR